MTPDPFHAGSGTLVKEPGLVWGGQERKAEEVRGGFLSMSLFFPCFTLLGFAQLPILGDYANANDEFTRKGTVGWVLEYVSCRI